MASYDDIINGSFNALAPGPAYQPGMTGRGLPLSAVGRLPQGVAGIDPTGWTPPPAPSWNTPTSIDLAAIDKYNSLVPSDASSPLSAMFPQRATNPAVAAAGNLGAPSGNVTASMKPQGWQGLLSMLFGPSKNGLTGVPGLLGGQNAGGLLGQLFGNKSGGLLAGTTPSGLPAGLNPQAAARAANFGGGKEVINSNGNYVTSNGEWHYSDPAHSGFTPISNNQSLS